MVKLTSRETLTRVFNGKDSYVLSLSNDTHTISTNEDGTGGSFAEAKTTLTVYKGGVDDTGNWTLSYTNGTGISGSLSGTTYSATGMTVDNGVVTLTATNKADSSLVLTKKFTLSKSRNGEPGISYSLVILSGKTIKKYKDRLVTDSEGVPSINSGIEYEGNIHARILKYRSSTQTTVSGFFEITEVSAETGAQTIKFFSSSPTQEVTYTLSKADLSNVVIKVYADRNKTTLLDVASVDIITDGQPSITVVNTNPNISLPADYKGVITDYNASTGEILVYEGTTDVTSLSTFSVLGGNRNLYDLSGFSNFEVSPSVSKVTKNVQTGEITVTVSGSDPYVGTVLNSGGQWVATLGPKIPIKPGRDMFVTITNPLFTKNYINILDSNGTATKNYTSFKGNKFKVPSSSFSGNDKFINLRFGISDGVAEVGTSYTTKIKVEYSSVGTDWTPNPDNSGYQDSDYLDVAPDGSFSFYPISNTKDFVKADIKISYRDMEFTSSVNLTKTKAGKDGSDAKLLFLTSDKQIFSLDKDGTPKETSITVKALNQNVEGDATFTVKGIKENGTTEPITVNPNNNAITLPSTLATKYSQIEVKATIGDLHDTLTISVVRDGSTSVTAFLTNEAVTLAASNAGVVTAASYNGAKGYFKLYEGSTDVSSSAKYSVTPPAGVTATIGADGAYSVTSVSATLDTTVVTFLAVYKGQTYSKDFSISKSKMGAAGIDAKMLTLSSDRDYFAFDKEGQPKPSNQTINVSANLHNISGNPTFEVKGYNSSNTATAISLTPSGTNLSIPVSEMSSYTYLTVKASLIVEGITYSDIKTFSRVTDGSQALTGWLTNESITVPASNTGTVLSSDLGYLTGTFKVFYGSEDVTNLASFSYTRNDNAYTFSINTSGVYSITTLSDSLDTFSIPLRAVYKGKEISKVLTISKSKMGSPGQDAKILNITTTRNYFAFDKEGQAKPRDQKVTITAHLKNIEGTASFEVKGYNSSNKPTTITIAPSASNVLEIPVDRMGSYVYLTVRAYVVANNSATYEDFTTISRVTDGSQALVGLLSNESITVPATSNGTVSSTDLAYLTGNFKVFYGSEDVTASSTFSYTRNDSAYTFSINSSGVYTIGALSASMDTFSIPVKATYNDKEVSKVISISKSKTGASGSNAKILTLTSDIQVFTLDKDGNPKGSNITVRALLQNLTGAVGFTVKGVEANGNETTLSVSPVNNSFILDKNLAKTYELVKITATLSGLTDTLTLPVVKDATLNITGVLTKETAVLSASNDGSVSTDAYNETKGYFKVYEGSTEVTGSTTFSVDRNLVIQHTTTKNVRLGPAGSDIINDNGYETTDYIKVEPNKPYTYRTYSEPPTFSATVLSLTWYSNNDGQESSWIDRPTGYLEHSDLKNGRTYVSPANAKFARVSYPSGMKVKLVKGKYTSDYSAAPEDSGVNAVINADGSYAVTSIPKNLDTVSVTLNGDYKDTRVTKVFTISKSKMGSAGLAARILNLSSTRDYFSYDRDNQPKPADQTITFNANLNNLSGTTRFEVKGYNASNTATVINITPSSANVLNLPISAMGSYVYITVRAYITSGDKTYEDTKTISRVMDGSQTLVGWLTNESVAVPATNTGSVSSTDLAYITGTFKVFYGSEDVTRASTFSYTRNDSAYTFSINNSGVYTVSALSTSLDSFSIPIKATYRGKEVSKVLSISKSRTGGDGTSAYMWIMYAKDGTGRDAIAIVPPDKEAEYTYIGFALTNTPERPDADSGKYTWTRYTGKDGIGINGRSVHIKYSNDGGKTFTGNNGEVAGKYIGIYVDDKLEDSNDPSDYTWNKAQGDDALPSYPNLISKGTLKPFKSKLVYDAKTNTYTVTTTQADNSWGSGITIPDTQVQYGEAYRVSAYVYVDSAEESLFAVDFNNVVAGVPATNDHDWRDDSVLDGHSGNDRLTRVPGRTWHLVYWGTTNKVPELIDESKFTRGWIKGDGSGEIVVQDVNGERTTDFIKVGGTIPYIFKYSVSLSEGKYAGANWQFYDTNKQPVGGRQGYGQVDDSSGNWSKTSEITTPTNVAYIRLTFRSFGNGHISFKRGLNPNEVPMYVQDNFGIRAVTAPKVFKIRDVKLELGKHVTPWVGSEEDLKGDPGVDAITPVLTNESITIPSDPDGNVSASTLSKVTTTVKIYKGTGELTNLTSWEFSASTLNGTGAYTMSGATLKLTGITSETLNIQITASHQTYGTYNRVFTVTKVYCGSDAKLLTINSDRSYFAYDCDNQPKPTNQVIKIPATLINMTGTPVFEITGYKNTSSAGTDLDIVQLGEGRNLARGSSKNWSPEHNSFHGQLNECFTTNNIYKPANLKVGDVITISVRLKWKDLVPASNQNMRLWMQTSGSRTVWNGGRLTGPGFTDTNDRPPTPSGEATLRASTVIGGDHLKNEYWELGFRVDYVASGSIQFKEIKAEVGSKNTPWCPAPEDFTNVETTQPTVTGSTLTLPVSAMGTYDYLKVKAHIDSDGDIYSDTETISRVTDGSQALTGWLTNESVSVPASINGTVSSSDLTQINGTFKVFYGSEDVTNSATFSHTRNDSQYTFSISSGGLYTVTALSSSVDSFSIPIRATYKGKEVSKTLSISKSKAGSNAATNITPALLPGYGLSYIPIEYATASPSIISPTGNGWARFYLNNTTGSEKRVSFRLPKVEGLTEGVPYTFLMEVRNNRSTFTEYFYVTANREAAFYKSGTTGQLSIATNQPGGVKRVVDTVNCPDGLDNAQILADFNITVPNGKTLDVEFRLSIYLGDYQGSYVPYQGSKNPYYYDMSLSNLVVTKNPSNTFSPASITATVNKFSDGETVPTNAVYKVIEFNSSGTQLKSITTESVAKETYTISNVNCSYLTIYAYNPNNTAEEWDHQTVYVVKDGTDSYSMDIVSNKGFIFSFDKDDNAVGFTQITLTPRITGNFTPSSYAWTKNGTAAGTSGVLTINASELKATNNITVGLTVNGKSAGVAATLTNYVNVTKAKDGSDAYIVHLSREVTAFPTNESGALLGSLTNNTTTVTAYKGTNAITPTITRLTTSGCTASYSGTTVTITGISADNGYVDIDISLEGKSVGTKRFSFVKVRQGQTMRMYNAWANSADGTVDFSTTESLGKKYIGVCTTTATSAPTTPSAYKWTETANNFTYGGRNWLMNSDFLENQYYWSTVFTENGKTEILTDSSDSVKYFRIKNTATNGGFIGVLNNSAMPVIKGDKVTVSGYIRVPDSSKPASIFKLEEDNVSGNEMVTKIYNWNSGEVKWDRPFVQNDNWNHFQVTYIITNENTRLLRFYMRVDRGTVDYKHLKLEGGNVATQWSPSPDDYARRLADVRAKADKANSDIADMADDGKLTPLEKTQISREVETIKSEYPIMVAQANTYGASDEKNTYTARYNSLINFVNPLLANMSVTSDLNIATFKAAFKDYYTSRTNLLNRIYKNLNDNTNNTASIIRKQISNVIQDITGWSVTTSDTYLTNATGAAQSKILNQLKSTIETTAKSIDLTVSSTTTGKKLNDNYYNKSQTDSKYATISVTDNRINLIVNGQTKTSFQINDGNIVFDLSGGGGTTTKVGTYTAYAWSPDGKDRFTKTKPQENMLVFSSDTANYAKSAPAPFIELNNNEQGQNMSYQDMGWLSKEHNKTLKDLGFKVGDKISVLFKFTVKYGGRTSFQIKGWGRDQWYITGMNVQNPGTYVVRNTVTLNEVALTTSRFFYFVWTVYNYLENSKSFTGSNIIGSSTLDSSTYQGFPVRRHVGNSSQSEIFQFDRFASLEVGQTYTASFWAKGTGKVRVYLYGNANYLQVKTGRTNQNATTTASDGAIDFTLSSNWQRYWVTYTMKDAFPTTNTSVKNHLLFRHLGSFGNTEQWFSGIQFEKGSTASTYVYLQSAQFEEMKIYREENPKEVFTLNPQDSYTESEPLYMGTSILDSDNPADYKWELNPARKPITVYSNDDDFLLPCISEPRPNLIDNSDFRDISQWQWLSQGSVFNDGSGENYVEISNGDYFYYGNNNNNNTRKFIRVSKTSALTLSFDYKENVRVNREVAVIELHSTEVGSTLLQRIAIPIEKFTGENINEMNKWKRIYYTFQNNFRQDVWIIVLFYGPKDATTNNKRYFRKPKLEVSDVPTPWQEKESDIPKYVGTGMKPSLSYKDFEWSLNPKWVEEYTKRGLDDTVNIKDYVNKIGEINSSISSKADQTDLDNVKSTADSVNNSFNNFIAPNTGKHDKDIAATAAKAESNLNAFKEQVVTFKFTNLISKIGDNGISISDNNQYMKMNLTNSRLEFTENGIVSAYISGKQFYITNGTITDIFQIGKHQFQKYNDEHTVVRWIK